jgi:hypothetical protein
VNLYVESQAELAVQGESENKSIRVHQYTSYPWDGAVTVVLKLELPVTFDLRLRIPGWCVEFGLTVNGEKLSERDFTIDRGYAVISRKWQHDDEIGLDLGMRARLTAAHRAVSADRGLVAVERGPLVYCAEEADNPDWEEPVVYDDSVAFVSAACEGLGNARQLNLRSIQSRCRDVVLVPYCLWDNRSQGRMRVWLRGDPSESLYFAAPRGDY